MKKTKMLLTFIVVVSFIITSACTERVNPGYYGMVMTPGGLSGEVLQPGNHSCYGRDKIVLVESKEVVKSESLSVLCADDLNFKFDLEIRSRLKSNDPKRFMEVLEKQGANIKWDGDIGTLEYEWLYKTYIQPPARAISRTIVSKYQTTQIREQREPITKSIKDRLLEAVEGTPVEITMVVTSNFDYPDVITKAMESKRQREIEIQEEKAKQAMELLRMENRLKLAQKAKITRVTEAQAEAAYVQILGNALTSTYLKLKDIEARRTLFEKIAPGDKVIMTNGTSVMINPNKK